MDVDMVELTQNLSAPMVKWLVETGESSDTREPAGLAYSVMNTHTRIKKEKLKKGLGEKSMLVQA